jgi:tetratricopeptide (TPR) repeat protein
VGKRSGAFYSSREVEKLLSLSPAQLASYLRAGFLTPQRGKGGEARFSLQDIVLLRTAKDLSRQVSARKVKRSLARLREQLPTARPLSAVRITAVGDEIVVRDGRTAWAPETGQGVLEFEVRELASKVAPLARRAARAFRSDERSLDAEGWFALGLDLEAADPAQARDAYRRALELEPGHNDARVNLGRLLHEAGHAAAAATHYRLALLARPKDPTAAYNLGVALEDLGQPGEAIAAYERAVQSDPAAADAHFNLSRLHERAGRKAAALRHLTAYRRITRA